MSAASLLTITTRTLSLGQYKPSPHPSEPSLGLSCSHTKRAIGGVCAVGCVYAYRRSPGLRGFVLLRRNPSLIVDQPVAGSTCSRPRATAAEGGGNNPQSPPPPIDSAKYREGKPGPGVPGGTSVLATTAGASATAYLLHNGPAS
jgi:hypothetical protein